MPQKMNNNNRIKNNPNHPLNNLASTLKDISMVDFHNKMNYYESLSNDFIEKYGDLPISSLTKTMAKYHIGYNALTESEALLKGDIDRRYHRKK